MYERFLKFWDTIRTSLWFVPSVMVVGAIGLSQLAIAVDRSQWGRDAAQSGWLHVTSAAGTRAMLSTVAASMITVAGVVFSITMVVLSQASNQFGSRLIRSFMYHQTTKICLGTFTGTFVFCIFALFVVDESVDEGFVPHLTASVGMLLALIGLGVLIYFIHHVAFYIQAPQVIASVGLELDAAIRREFPECNNDESDAESCSTDPVESPEDSGRESRTVSAPFQGYVQAVDADGVVGPARRHKSVAKLLRRAGDYVPRNAALARVWPADSIDDELSEAIVGAFVYGSVRTPIQDPLYAVDQLVEIAVRALSPGVNDPFTAVECVHRLVGGLCGLVGRRVRSPHHFDDDGSLRVVSGKVSVGEMVHRAFDPIRSHARGDRSVYKALLEAIEEMAPIATDGDVRKVLRRQADIIRQSALDSLTIEHDRQVLEKQYAIVCRAVEP